MERIAGEIRGGHPEIHRQRSVRGCDLARSDASADSCGRIRKLVPHAAPVVRFDVRNTVTRPTVFDDVTVTFIDCAVERDRRY